MHAMQSDSLCMLYATRNRSDFGAMKEEEEEEEDEEEGNDGAEEYGDAKEKRDDAENALAKLDDNDDDGAEYDEE